MFVLAYTYTTSPGFASANLIHALEGYYPQNTLFYADMTPEPATIQRFQALIKRLATASPKGSSSASELEKHQDTDLILTVTNEWITQSGAMGLWVDPLPETPPSETTPKQTLSQFHMLTILPIRPDKDPAEFRSFLLAILGASAKPFTEQQENGVYYFKSNRKNSPILSIDEHNLLICDSFKTLETALAEKQTPSSILNNSFYQKYLPLLPETRQGTMLFSMQDFTALNQLLQLTKSMKLSPSVQAQSEKLTVFLKNYLSAIPGGVGSMEIDETQWTVKAHFMTPMQWENIQDEAFKTDIQALFGQPPALSDLLKALPEETLAFYQVANMEKGYDLIFRHALTEKIQSWISKHTTEMLTPLELDFRTNIINLFGPQLAGAVTLSPQFNFSAFLSRSPETQTTYEKALAILQLAPDLALEKITRQSGETLYIAGAKSKPKGFKFAMTEFNPNLFAIGTPQALKDVEAVQVGQKPSLYSYLSSQSLLSTFPENTLSFFYFNNTQLMHYFKERLSKKAETKTEPSPSEPVTPSTENTVTEPEPSNPSPLAAPKETLQHIVKSVPADSEKMAVNLLDSIKTLHMASYYDEASAVFHGTLVLKLQRFEQK